MAGFYSATLSTTPASHGLLCHRRIQHSPERRHVVIERQTGRLQISPRSARRSLNQSASVIVSANQHCLGEVRGDGP